MTASLAPRLLAEVSDLQRGSTSAADLEPVLERLLADASGAWPDVHVDPGELMAFLGPRLPADQPLPEALAALHAADLFLAFACARGDRAALIHAYRVLEKAVASAFASMPLPGLDPADVTQRLCERLLLSDGASAARLTDFSGRAPLRAWLRVIAVRELLQLRRKQRREVGPTAPGDDDEVLRWLTAGAPDTEVKARYRTQVQEVLGHALRTLTVRQRNLLRQHYQYGLTLDQLATLYAVHRATCARWLAEARDQVLETTRRRLEEELGADAEEARAIIRMVISQLELPLSHTLTRPPGG